MVVSPSRILCFCDCWIYRKIKQTLQFLQELANFHICRRFWASTQPLTSSQSAFSQRKVVYQLKKFNEHPCILIMPDLQELHWTNWPKVERIHATRLICSGCSRSCNTVIHSAGRYSEERKKEVEFSAESITSQSDHVRRIQIRWRILLKLRISEQTPLMWKPGETLLSEQLHHSPWI